MPVTMTVMVGKTCLSLTLTESCSPGVTRRKTVCGYPMTTFCLASSKVTRLPECSAAIVTQSATEWL